MATIALPGLFSPVRWGQFQLIDGGVLNNLPADIVRQMGADIVIAVDISPDLLARPATGKTPAIEEKLWPSLIPGFARDFYLAEIIMIQAIMKTRLAETKPDFTIRPKINPEVSIFWGFAHADQAIQAGEEAMRQILTEIHQFILNF